MRALPPTDWKKLVQVRVLLFCWVTFELKLLERMVPVSGIERPPTFSLCKERVLQDCKYSVVVVMGDLFHEAVRNQHH